MKQLESKDFWDIALSIFLLSISIITLVGVSNVREFQYEQLGPKFLPKALSYCFIFMSGLLILRIFTRKQTVYSNIIENIDDDKIIEKQKELNKSHPWLAVLTVIMISLYIGTLNLLGFRVSSLIFMSVLGVILIKFENKPRKIVKIISLLLLTVLLSFGLYYVFREILGVRVP